MAENMLKIAHPGRYGDLFWALPTMRALSEVHGRLVHVLLPTDPANTTPMAPLVPLLMAQPYIGCATVVQDWSIVQDAPRAPHMPPHAGLDVMSLGYTEWPREPLPYEAAHLGGVHYQATGTPEEFFRPWIHIPTETAPRFPYPTVAVAFTDRYFELKLGILSEIRRLMPGVHLQWFAQPGSRMCDAGAAQVDLWDLMHYLWMADVVLADCSMAHVLACGLGVRRVLVVEPEEARHHFVFWPGSILPEWRQMGTPIGERVRPVLGGDGRPTFDSRHTIHEITRVLEEK